MIEYVSEVKAKAGKGEVEEPNQSAGPVARRSGFHVRRDKAALFQWVQGPPGDRSSRKQPRQAWR